MNRSGILRRAVERATRSLRGLIVMATVLSWASPVRAGGADGQVVGVETLLDSGPVHEKQCIVFIGDGFTAGELPLFRQKASEAVEHLLAAHPFQALHCAFNIYRVDLVSTESGTDIPATCGGNSTGLPAQERATALDTGYCGDSEQKRFRLIRSDNSLVFYFAKQEAPCFNYIVVLVNDHNRAGSASGGFIYVSLSDDFRDTIVHELGHAIGGLGDEYTDDDEDPNGTVFKDVEPMDEANLSTATTRADVKWADLISPTTPIPTGEFGTAVDAPFDLVGTYEGAHGEFSRGIYRPQPICLMRDSSYPFCAVCRRAIITEVRDSLCAPLAVHADEIAVFDTHEPSFKGAGDIYFFYDLASNLDTRAGRWPDWDATVDFDGGQTRSLNAYFMGVMPEPFPGTEAVLQVRVRDDDWPDGDDTLANDASVTFSAPGPYEIVQPDYRLAGRVERASLHVLLDTLHIKADHDPTTAADVFLKYRISNAMQAIEGRWPASGTREMDGGTSRPIEILAGALARPTGGDSLTLQVEVWDEDGFLAGSDDKIGTITSSFDASDGYGSAGIVHVVDDVALRLTFSIVDSP